MEYVKLKRICIQRTKKWLFMIALALLVLGLSCEGFAAGQTFFKSAGEAANSLVIAVAQDDDTALTHILGQDYRKLLPMDKIKGDVVDRFLHSWIGFHTLLSKDAKTRMLAVGENGWTFPVPIVKEKQGWRFDTAAGLELMRIRQIGRNELSTMQAVYAYHDAQMEYALKDRDGDGVLEYAQRFISSKGKRNGLFWETTPGEPKSPLGHFFADASKPKNTYHGYHYRILKSQGKYAKGGAYSYIVKGNMVSGFAIVAWPAEYGITGVMSFLLSREGTLYEADLGPKSQAVASAMSEYDPDSRWAPVSEEFTDLRSLRGSKVSP
jgi:hypothetical protein